MSDSDTPQSPARLEQFRHEVDGLRVSGGKVSPERTWSLIGAVMLGLGLAVALLSALAQRGDTTQGDATAILNEIVSANNAQIVMIMGLSLAIVGGLVWVRNSLTRYLRYWLVRLIYEDRSNTDRLIEAIRDTQHSSD